MAHFVFMPPLSLNSNNPYRRSSMPQPPQSQAEMNKQQRNDSVSSTSSTNTPSPGYNPAARRNSSLAAHRNPRIFDTPNIRTKSIPGVFGSAGVVFERDGRSLNDDDIIMVTVRLTNNFRKGSVDGAEDLPSRPPRRGFLRRLSTRVSNSLEDSAAREDRYKAIKMPRAEYKRHFKRDNEGNYAGTEPERQWDLEELMEEYGEYQDIPLGSVLF